MTDDPISNAYCVCISAAHATWKSRYSCEVKSRKVLGECRGLSETHILQLQLANMLGGCPGILRNNMGTLPYPAFSKNGRMASKSDIYERFDLSNTRRYLDPVLSCLTCICCIKRSKYDDVQISLSFRNFPRILC